MGRGIDGLAGRVSWRSLVATDAQDRRVDDRRQAFAAEVVDDAEHAEPPAVRQGIRHEVERPALVRFLRDCHGRPGPDRALPVATPTYRERLFPVYVIVLLPVDLPTFLLRQDKQAPVTEPSRARRPFLLRHKQFSVLQGLQAASVHARTDPGHRIRPPYRVFLLSDAPVHGFLPRTGPQKASFRASVSTRQRLSSARPASSSVSRSPPQAT